jgi:hypothetical protein
MMRQALTCDFKYLETRACCARGIDQPSEGAGRP